MSLILVAEDSHSMALAAGKSLERHGHKVILAQTQAEAVSQYQERKPDLVLTEYYLQEGSGLGLLEALSKLDPELQIIMTTGYGREELVSEVMSKGASQYISKNEDYLERLPEIVEEAIKARAAQKQAGERRQQAARLETQNELSGWMAHNFKNILSAGMGYLNLIKLDNPEQGIAKQKEFLEGCRESLERSLAILEQLLEMTKGRAGEAEKLLVAESVDEAWSEVQKKAVAKAEGDGLAGNQIRTLLDRAAFLNATRSLPPQFLVKRDFRSILEALLQNALEAVLQTEQPRILVRGELKSGFLEVTVKDNGRGMSEDVQRHALEPLFSTKGEVGVGLSLSLARSLVVRHGGELRFESVLKQGSTFTFNWAL